MSSASTHSTPERSAWYVYQDHGLRLSDPCELGIHKESCEFECKKGKDRKVKGLPNCFVKKSWTVQRMRNALREEGLGCLPESKVCIYWSMWGECQHNGCRYKHYIEWTKGKGLFVSLSDDDVLYGRSAPSVLDTGRNAVYGDVKDVHSSSSSSSSDVAHNSYSRRNGHPQRHANYSVPHSTNGVNSRDVHQEQRGSKGIKPFSSNFDDFMINTCTGCGACDGK